MERGFHKDAPVCVGCNCFNRCSSKGFGVPPIAGAVLVADIARLRRSPDIAGLLCMEAVTHTLPELRLFSLGAGFRKTSYKLSLLSIIDQRVQDFKSYGHLCVSVQCFGFSYKKKKKMKSM